MCDFDREQTGRGAHQAMRQDRKRNLMQCLLIFADLQPHEIKMNSKLCRKANTTVSCSYNWLCFRGCYKILDFRGQGCVKNCNGGQPCVHSMVFHVLYCPWWLFSTCWRGGVGLEWEFSSTASQGGPGQGRHFIQCASQIPVSVIRKVFLSLPGE